MSGLGYNRCPNDNWKAGSAVIGVNPKTGQSIEIDIHGIAAAISVQSALLQLTASMKTGHTDDFIERLALTLLPKVESDPHSLCPLLTLLSMILMLVQGHVGVTFGKDGRVIITPPDVKIEPGEVCMIDEENDYGTDERTMGGDASSTLTLEDNEDDSDEQYDPGDDITPNTDD